MLFLPAFGFLASMGLLTMGEARLSKPGSADSRPANFKLLYQQDFTGAEPLADFEFTDPSAWRIAKTPDGPALELFGQSKYAPKHRSPLNIALIKGKSFADFDLELEARSTVKPYNHQDLCFFLDVLTPSRFYYAHLAVRADPHAHNVMIVNDAPRLAIAKTHTHGVVWKENTWHKIRLERRSQTGTIKVFFDDWTKPVMEAEDKTHLDGRIGLGSFDDKGMFRAIRIYGPQVQMTPGDPFFKK